MSDRQPDDEGSSAGESGSDEINEPLTTDAEAPRTPFQPSNNDE